MIITAFNLFGKVYLNKGRITLRIRLFQWKEYFHTKLIVNTGRKYYTDGSDIVFGDGIKNLKRK